MWQLFPLLMIAGVAYYVFKLRGGASSEQSEAYYRERDEKVRAALGLDLADGGPSACIVTYTHSMLGAKVYVVGLNERRLAFIGPDGATRSFERGSQATLTMARQRFSDQGNTQVTISTGWEIDVSLPGGEALVWRAFESFAPVPQQATELEKFRQLAASPGRSVTA